MPIIEDSVVHKPVDVKPRKDVLSSEDKATFKAILEGVAANPRLGVIANRFPWQARMAIEKLLEVAKNTQSPVRMLSGGGAESFYDDCLATNLRNCKSAGCSPIQVMVWQKDFNDLSPALVRLAEEGIIELAVSGTDDFADSIAHFLLIGDFAFRQEATHRRFGKDTNFNDVDPQTPARIDFDDKETGAKLKQTFVELWGSE